MTNDEILAAAIRLIKAGKKEAARSILEPFLAQNPNHVQAWMWLAELYPNDGDKIKVLESCLSKNRNNPQVTQALNFLKKRSGQPSGISAATRVSTSPFTTAPPTSSSPFSDSPAASPFAEQPAKKPLPPIFTESPSAKPAPPSFSTSPFSSSPFSSEANQSSVASQQTKAPLPPPPIETSEPAPVFDKKQKRKNSKTKDILIIAVALVVFALLAGGYISGGFYLNGQINKSFAAQKCESVAQYSYFASLYPQGLFASTFAGYDQYAECRLKLDIDQAVEAKDWETVIALAQEYLTAYPSGTFAADVNQKAASALTAWSKELIVHQDYANGIEKLKQLIETYPDAPESKSAQDDILQTYLAWTKELTDKQSYSEAEQNLKSALAYFEADAARGEKVKEELVNVYVSWGDMQIGIGNVDNAITYYQQAGETLPGKTDVDLLIAKAYLKQALDIANKDDFNRALSKVQELANTAQAENVKAEINAARETILKKYSDSASQQGVEQITNVMPLICRGESPELPIFGLDKKNVRFGLVTLIPMQLPKGLAAETPGQLHYVACAVETEKEIQTCPYKGGHALTRFRYEWTVTLYDILAKTEFNSNVFEGSDPAECKTNEPFPSGVMNRKSYGGKPTLDQISAWLKELNIVTAQ